MVFPGSILVLYLKRMSSCSQLKIGVMFLIGYACVEADNILLSVRSQYWVWVIACRFDSPCTAATVTHMACWQQGSVTWSWRPILR